MKPSRREFCLLCASGCATLALGCATASMRGSYDRTAGTLRASLADWPTGEEVVLAYASGRHNPVVLVRDGDAYRALSSECTHQGCAVSVGMGALRCPCHGSAFDLHGNATRGPAKTPLPSYPVRREGDELVVELRSAP